MFIPFFCISNFMSITIVRVPNTGWMVLIPTDEIRYLDISADKAMKFIIGGGFGSPSYIEWVGREKEVEG